MKKVSIIIPVYNAEKYLDNCLNSVVNQTLSSIEIIIVNDGSNDASLSICEKYAIRDNRINIINKKNEGVSIARNTGIEFATGEYIMFVDSDDWIDLNMCEVMVNEIISKDADIVFCNHIKEYNDKSKREEFDSKREFIGNNAVKSDIILPLIEEDDGDIHHKRASFRSPWGKLFKRSIIMNNNIRFNKNLIIGEDFIFDLEYLKYCSRVSMDERNLYHYRINEDSVLVRYKENPWRFYKILLTYLEEYLRKNFNENEYLARLNKLKIKYFIICLRNEMSPLNKKSFLEKKKYLAVICEDELMTLALKSFKGKMLSKKEHISLFLLRNKMYSIYLISKSIKY